jgi:hypothetical protein
MDKSLDEGREILKWIAIITMTIDHIGATLYPELAILRYVGRLSFPLFCYLLVLGFESTRNVSNYFMRLFLFASISQAPFYLALGIEPFESLNIFFTLSSGLLFIYFYQNNPLLTFLPLLASVVLNFDYGIYGILLIGCMHLLGKNLELGVVSSVLLNLLFLLVWPTQALSLFALPIILLHKIGPLKMVRKFDEKTTYPSWKKYFFYIYYPLHLAILYHLRVGF